MAKQWPLHSSNVICCKTDTHVKPQTERWDCDFTYNVLLYDTLVNLIEFLTLSPVQVNHLDGGHTESTLLYDA